MHQTFLLSLFLICPPFLFLFLLIKRANCKNLNLPPSPSRLPFIGNLHQLGSLLHRSLRDLSDKHGPLMLLQIGQIPTLVVSSPQMAKEVMKTHDLIFASRRHSKISRILLHDDFAFAPFGEYWRQARKLCVSHLSSSKMVQSFQSLKEKEIEMMVHKISQIASSNQTVNMSEVLELFSCNVLARVVSDKFSREDRKDLIRVLAEENSALIGAFYLGDSFPMLGWLDISGLASRAKRTAKEWNNVLDEVIEEHATGMLEDDGDHKKADFVDVLLSLENESSIDFPFTRENIKAILIDMFAAGIDTSYSVLEWGMTELVRNPEVMKKLQDKVRGLAKGKHIIRENDLSKMDYLKAVIKEVMRLHPPVPLLLPRESTETCELGGYHIPKDTRVIVNAWAIGRDSNVWEEPDAFKPDRFIDNQIDFRGNDFEFIPFGAGRRICPGINFAMQTVELGLANLVSRFDWELPGNMSIDDLDMRETLGVVVGRKQRLDLVAKLFRLI